MPLPCPNFLLLATFVLKVIDHVTIHNMGTLPHGGTYILLYPGQGPRSQNNALLPYYPGQDAAWASASRAWQKYSKTNMKYGTLSGEEALTPKFFAQFNLDKLLAEDGTNPSARDRNQHHGEGAGGTNPSARDRNQHGRDGDAQAGDGVTR
ncbi:unnamed protein product, partial [Amoebophrya sp. A25]|eukprot:GSA25T00016399001.1